MEVKISEIVVGENKLREVQNDEELDDLCASIRRIGIVEPLIVAAAGEGYELVGGHRRFAAAVSCGLESVPVVVRSGGKSERAEVAFAENLFRKDLSPVETAAALKDVLAEEKMTMEELGRAVHRSAHWVRQMVAMTDWPPDVLLAIHEGAISTAAGANLAGVTDDEYRAFLVQNAVENGATARSTAAWLQAWRSMIPPQEAIDRPPVDGRPPVAPLIPQAPCLCCGDVFRMDALSHVPVCSNCVQVLRNAGQSVGG